MRQQRCGSRPWSRSTGCSGGAARAASETMRNSISWRVIAGFGGNAERREAGGRHKPDFDLSPFAVASGIAGAIAEQVLISQLKADFGSGRREVLDVADGEGAAAAGLADAPQQARTRRLFRPGEQKHAFVDADGIHLDVGFHDHLADFPRRVPTAVVPTVRD